MYLNRTIKLRNVLLMLFIFTLINPASASVEISDFFSDFTSSDVTVTSSQHFEGKAVFELVYAGNSVESHEVPFSIKAGESATRVIIWEKRPQHDYYTAKVSIYNGSKMIASSSYPVSYGTVSLPGFHVVDFSPTNSGVQLLLRPFSPNAVDIRIEVLDGSNIVYSETKEDIPVTVNKEIKFSWPFLLENNRDYTVRAKIFTHRLYAEPLINTYVAHFTATEDVEILKEDVEVDEYGASVTIRGKSQVPFDGYIVVTARNRATDETHTFRQQIEEILVSGKEDTAGVVWKGLSPGTYNVEILAVNQENVTVDRYETVLRMPQAPVYVKTTQNKTTPGFGVLMLLIMLLAAAYRLKGG